MAGPRVRRDLGGIPSYRPGRPAAADEAAVKLSSNENPYPPLPSVVEAMSRAAHGVNRYPDMAGSALVHALSDRLHIPADEVVLGPGSVGVLAQVVTAMAGPGDEVVFAWRSFEAYPIVTQVAGATPVAVPLARDGGHDMDAMAAAVTDRTRLVLVCSPNNPTGTTVRADAVERLLQRVPSDVLVVVDEAYAEFVRDSSAVDGLSVFARHPNVAVLRTFSKAYGLAGLRVGFGLAHEPVASGLRTTALPFGVSSPAQEAALESLRHTDELEQRVDMLVAERTRVVARLSQQGWRLPVTQANFVWLPLGDRTASFSAACGDVAVAVRAFGGEGVRVTIGEPADNDRWLAVAEQYAAA